MTRKFRVVAGMVLGALLAVALLTGAGKLLASTLASDPIPEIVNYQGFLTDAGGSPVSSTVTLNFKIFDASSGGTELWAETHNNVQVNEGFFSVFLGSQGTPLTPSVFSGTSRYLELTFNGTTFARQRFASVPYALVSYQASKAISSTYALTATYALNGPSSSSSGVEWQYVKVVAKSGGDYTSVTEAMSAITPTSSSRYLILVMPGTYEGQVTVKPYVHVKGAGVASTIISATMSTNNPNDDGAAALILPANAQLSDLSVVNGASTEDSTGIKVSTPNAATIVDNVHVKVTVPGGQDRRGIYATGGLDTPTFNNVYVEVSGGSAQNWGFFNSAVTPIIQNSTIKGIGAFGTGLRFNGGGATITDSTISGMNGNNGDGINSSGTGNDIFIDRSSIIGDPPPNGSSIEANTTYEFYVGASKLQGDADVTAPADITCAQSYSTAYAALNANCQ